MIYMITSFIIINVLVFLSATEYHSDADYNSRRVGVVVIVVVIVVVVQTMLVQYYFCYGVA